MSQDDAALGQSGLYGAKLIEHRFASEAVEPIAHDALFEKTARDGVDPGDFRKRGVKGGVEAGYLRQVRKTLRDGLDGTQRRWGVIWVERDEAAELREELWRDLLRLHVTRPALNQAMARGAQTGDVAVGAEPIEQSLSPGVYGFAGRDLGIEEQGACSVFHGELGARIAGRGVDESGKQGRWRGVAAGVEQRSLQRARAAI